MTYTRFTMETANVAADQLRALGAVASVRPEGNGQPVAVLGTLGKASKEWVWANLFAAVDALETLKRIADADASESAANKRYRRAERGNK